MHTDRRLLLPLFLAVLTSATAAAQERELHWQSLDVRARLGADGRLQVTETHGMVFTGDWNGGERGFRLDDGQRLRLRGVSRRDPQTGETVPLVEGDLSQVDHYGFTDSKTLRWRSRLPSDAPFDKTALTYVIDYELSDVLQPREGGEFLLDHDFAFRERPGVIEDFRLTLEVDPAWRSGGDLPARIERRALPPGQGVVVTAPLRYTREGAPAGVRLGASPTIRTALLVLLAAAFALLWA
ncbi:MAG: hypothetical protein H7X85_02785, partial [Thermoanaerobaculia bacterium]|nr:hypothetical protein [Thermoanaerobaculia bacterium]